MNIRKHFGLVVSGAVAAVLMLGAVFFLVRYLRAYSGLAGELRQAQQRLDQLNARKPFPNAENVEQLERNVGALRERLDEFVTRLRRSAYEPPVIEPAKFPLVMGQTLSGLRGVARENNVALPEGFQFGFDRYARQLPDRGSIPRLATQLHYVDRLGRVVLGARVVAIESLQRQPFEEAGATQTPDDDGGGRRRREPVADGGGGSALPRTLPGDPYGLSRRERFTLRFTVRENALWELLNRLATDEVFFVVADVALQNNAKPQALSLDKAPAVAAAPGDTGPGGTNRVAVADREQRVVAGRDEILSVQLTVDVYDFGGRPAAATEEGAP